MITWFRNVRWPFVRRSRVEDVLASLVDMRDDYVTATGEWPEGQSVDMPSYKKGKRDAYRRSARSLGEIL